MPWVGTGKNASGPVTSRGGNSFVSKEQMNWIVLIVAGFFEVPLHFVITTTL